MKKINILMLFCLLLAVSASAQMMNHDHHMMMGGTPEAMSHKMEMKATDEARVYSTADLHVQPAHEFVVLAHRFAFEPSELRVKKDERVRIFGSASDTTHGFTLNDFGISTQLEKDKVKVIEFTADKTGTFDFRCTVFCGVGHPGMKGKLVVE